MIGFKKLYHIFIQNLELVFWITGLTYLALISPEQAHFSFCPLNQAGISWCPGCGLGKSISMFFHLNVVQSFKTHPLGVFAIGIILIRIIQLIKNIRREHNGKHLQLSSRA